MDEEPCQNCGRCCEIMAQEGDFYRLTGEDCEHLERHPDGKTSCRVYHSRFFTKLKGGNVCAPMKEALASGDLPPDCPYAMATPGYQTKVIDWMKEIR